MTATKVETGREYDKQNKRCKGIWKEHYERQIVGGASIRSRNGAPPRKGCVVNGHAT